MADSARQSAQPRLIQFLRTKNLHPKASACAWCRKRLPASDCVTCRVHGVLNTGSLPSDLSGYAEMDLLDVSGNQLSGSLPKGEFGVWVAEPPPPPGQEGGGQVFLMRGRGVLCWMLLATD
jgi:hypothetical protein